MMQVVAGHLFLPGERLAPTQGVGFLVGFLGVVALFATDLNDLGPAAIPAGAVLLLSPLVSAFGTTYVKRHGAGTSSMLLNRNGMWYGAGLLWIATLATERDAPFRVTGTALFTLAYLAVFGTVVAFGLHLLLWSVPFFLVALLKRAVDRSPKWRARLGYLLTRVGEGWITGNNVLIACTQPLTYEVRGLDGLTLRVVPAADSEPAAEDAAPAIAGSVGPAGRSPSPPSPSRHPRNLESRPLQEIPGCLS